MTGRNGADVVMEAVALASGSNGNAILVKTPDARLLFDAGGSGRHLERRAASRGVSVADADAILLSHGHGDHVAGAGVLNRRFGLPVHATRGTWRLAERRVGSVSAAHVFRPGATLTFGTTQVHTIPTPHDAPESVAFVVEARGVRLGILTDLGHVFPGLPEVVATLDGAFLESNHDSEMLAYGPYPAFLRDRIAGPEGHLSNEDTVRLVANAANGRLQSLALAHLSGECNTPDVALENAEPLGALCPEVCVAPRDQASPVLRLRG